MTDKPKLAFINGSREDLEQRILTALLQSIVSADKDRTELDRLMVILNHRASLALVSDKQDKTSDENNIERGERN